MAFPNRPSRYRFLWCICLGFAIALATSPPRLHELAEENLHAGDHSSALQLCPGAPDSWCHLSPPRSTGAEKTSNKRKYPNDHHSTTDTSGRRNPAQSPKEDLGSSSAHSTNERIKAGARKRRKIQYIDFFAKGTHSNIDNNHPKINHDIIERRNNNFRSKIKLKQTNFDDPFVKHENLPFGRVTYRFGQPGRPSEVLQASYTYGRQTYDNWRSLYNSLIIALSAKLAEDYKSLGVSRKRYEWEQGDLLKWLDKEIFSPHNSLPIIGLSRYSFGSEAIDDFTLKPNQIKLIEYFAQDVWNPQTEDTVAYLLKTYHESKHEAEGSMEPPEYLNSKENRESIKPLCEFFDKNYGLFYT
ncbi:hypothetical protein MJO28_003996 [Puccinia striiformis f. sp. tritici]|uniref:Uncharacterized protein n=2 Tax=Puccinia striiformis TaxID=27350 RepID=A0A2S4UMI0_9BASI|nr:hypothetical protein MJO28_003996 [Puccinia striiformis f. sp. tritici]POV98522.1 hypothetical protein PSTT_14378 [Puccinia striiformis]